MSAVLLTRIDRAQNMARFYKLDVQPTLFGEWALVCEWGRIGQDGTVRATPTALPVRPKLQAIGSGAKKRGEDIVARAPNCAYAS
jgi:hypothetical protein